MKIYCEVYKNAYPDPEFIRQTCFEGDKESCIEFMRKLLNELELNIECISCHSTYKGSEIGNIEASYLCIDGQRYNKSWYID